LRTGSLHTNLSFATTPDPDLECWSPGPWTAACNSVADRGHELGHGFAESLEVQHLSLGARNGHDNEEDEDGRPGRG